MHRKKKRQPVTAKEIDKAWHETYGIYFCPECGCNYSRWCPTHGGPKTCEVVKSEALDD